MPAMHNLVKTKKIIVRAKTDDHSLCVTIDNTFSGSLDIDQEGHFVSSKHEALVLELNPSKVLPKNMAEFASLKPTTVCSMPL